MTQLVALFKVLTKTQLTKGRIILIVAFGILSVAVSATIRTNTGVSTERTIQFLSAFGLSLMVPVISLVTASSVFGQLVEDETLVYLWLRPAPRWVLALSAWTSAATIAIPATVVPLGVAAFVGTGGDRDSVIATAAATGLAALAYSAIFTFVGLLVRRALVWGLVYVFVWELFVARIGSGAAKLALGTYPSSVIARTSDVELRLADYSTATGVTVPVLVAAVALVITTLSLKWTDIA